MDDVQKDKMKLLFSDWKGLSEEKKAINLEIGMLLKKDSEYQKLMDQKKELLHEVREKIIKISGTLFDERDKITENIKLIVHDIKETLEINSTVVNSIFKFYKKKYDHGIDELDVITTHFLEIFQLDEEMDKNQS